MYILREIERESITTNCEIWRRSPSAWQMEVSGARINNLARSGCCLLDWNRSDRGPRLRIATEASYYSTTLAGPRLSLLACLR